VPVCGGGLAAILVRMPRLRLALLAMVCVLASAAQQTIPMEEYRARRAELRQAVSDGVVVLFGQKARENDHSRSGSSQEPNFYYLTGWEEPGAILVIAAPATEILFLPAHDPKVERYTGRKTSAEDEDARAVTGFEQVLPAGKFETQLSKLLESSPKVYTRNGRTNAARLKELLPLREVLDAGGAVAGLRMKKSAREIELIQRAVEVTIQAHQAAWKRIAPGLFEYQIAATMTAAILEAGCQRSAYSPIVGAGPNALVLHYEKNSRRMDKGELLLMDVGGECSAYAADITRTAPVSGKFTARQRELYNVVLGAQKALIAAVKPGILPGKDKTTPNSLYKLACDYIDSHGRDRQGNSLGQYLTHGVSHHVGLDVHDPGAPERPLEAGMVITVEPGIYIPEEGLGIRIEDMVLVTESGARVLSAALPREAEQIEKAMARQE